MDNGVVPLETLSVFASASGLILGVQSRVLRNVPHSLRDQAVGRVVARRIGAMTDREAWGKIIKLLQAVLQVVYEWKVKAND